MIRELVDIEDRREAAAEALRWGYPRDVTWLEVVHARWWRTERGVGWLIEGECEGELHFHGAGDPKVRQVVDAEWTAVVREQARALGARWVIAPLWIAGARLERKQRALAHVLWRAGWTTWHDLGPCLEV